MNRKGDLFKGDVIVATHLCPHEFPAKKPSCPTIFPFDCMKFIIDEILGIKKLGVIVPLESQKEMTMLSSWIA